MNSLFHSFIQHFVKKAFWAIVFVSLVMSCKKGEEPDPTDPNPPVEEGVFTTGPEQTYKVAGTGVVEIKDTITGATFRFPKGGTGTLSIARVLASKDYTLPTAGSGLNTVSITYSGSEDEPIEILLPNNGIALPAIWALQYPTGCVDDGEADKAAWMPMYSVDPTKNPAVYPMNFNPKVVTKNGRTTGWVIPVLAIGALIAAPAAIYDLTQLYSFSNKTSTALENLVNPLPSPQRDTLIKRIQGAYQLKIFNSNVITSVGSISNYNAFDKTGKRLPQITYITRGWGWNKVEKVATDATVYHETGHYLSHVIGGDATMKKMQLQANANPAHGVGLPAPGRDMIEEYAYWSEATLNGFQFGDKPNLFSTSVAGVLTNTSPENIDFPKIEGYGAVLMAYLTHKGSTITFSVRDGPQDSPSIGLSVPEVWGILTQSTAVPSAPATKDELYTAIQTYLKKNQPSKAEFLPVIAQRTGWRYKVKARLVTESGMGTNKIQTPIPYARVLGVFKSSSTGAKEYFSQKDSVTTDLNGNLEITKIFPEKSYLRVVFEKDKIKYVKDIEINVPISQLTNEAFDLKDIVVPLNDVLFQASISVAGILSTSDGNALTSFPVSISTSSGGKLEDNAGVVSGTSPSGTLELKYNPTTFALISFSYKETPTSANGYREVSIKGGGIPSTSFKRGEGYGGNYTYNWSIRGTQIDNYLYQATSYNVVTGFRIYGVVPFDDGDFARTSTLGISLYFTKN